MRHSRVAMCHTVQQMAAFTLFFYRMKIWNGWRTTFLAPLVICKAHSNMVTMYKISLNGSNRIICALFCQYRALPVLLDSDEVLKFELTLCTCMEIKIFFLFTLFFRKLWQPSMRCQNWSDSSCWPSADTEVVLSQDCPWHYLSVRCTSAIRHLYFWFQSPVELQRNAAKPFSGDLLLLNF